MIKVSEFFGDIDIYLFDQILKHQFNKQTVVLDAGCGGGRNLIYFLRQGCQVFGVDINPDAVSCVQSLASRLSPDSPIENFQIADIQEIPFPTDHFDLVISNAVLHFAENGGHFNRIFHEMWRVTKPGGMLFARLASSIGIENKIEYIENGRYLLPDGSERFLVDEETLLRVTKESGGTLVEPIKTTNVQNLRAMTTWVLRKSFF